MNHSENKTVVFFCQKFFPQRGGIQTLLHNICLAIQKNSSWNVVLITLTPAESEEKKFPYEVYRLPSDKNIFTRGILFLRLYRLLTALKPDHVVLGYWSRYADLFSTLSRLLSFPFSLVIHGKEITFPRKGKGYRIFKRRASRASFVIANSSYTKGVYEKLNLSPPALVMNPGLNYDLLSLKTLELRKKIQQERKDRKSLSLLFVGRLVKRKGCDYLLKAVAILKSRHIPVQLTIVGSGNDLRRLQTLRENYGLQDAVSFQSELADEELYRVYCENDIFVMPSRNLPDTGDYEGFGIVYLEANFFGLPVIGGREGGVPDAIKEGVNGILCDPYSPEDIAEKILLVREQFIDAPDLHKKLLAFLSEQFNWDRLIQPVIQKIEETF